MIVGTVIVIALFAALIGPWFINWNDYRGTFEAEAEKILGHKVHVAGTARATILPSPSLTFTEVEVGDTEGAPMMTVERFEVVIELMPLLQGEIRVVSMVLDKPAARVSVGDTGEVEWLLRSEASKALDPEKVVLNDVEIRDGAILYEDARTKRSQRFEHVNATIEARALNGPWHIAGSYLDGNGRVPFQFATGRQLDDGTLRVKTDFSPSRWPLAVAADGVVSIDAKFGITYRGTYAVSQVSTAPAEKAGAAGWRSEGTFLFTGERLAIEKAILSSGPPDRPSSVAGSLTVDLGEHPSFQASAEARQIDLDRTLADGPTRPLEVSAGVQRLVDWLSGLPVVNMPGRVTFSVPAIVVGGSVIQDVGFAAEPAKGGWKIVGLRARLPGASTLNADGVLTTEQKVGFVGDLRLAVDQPATFATWWRGRAQEGAGRLLASFDLAGRADIAAGRVAVDQVKARIGDAVITGRFSWNESARDRRRQLGTDLKAERIDFVQLRALAELLVGRNLGDAGVLADSYSVRLTAKSFQMDDIAMRDVAIDAAYADDVLNVVQLAIGDIGGANFRVTSGRIENVSKDPRGRLDARFEATTLTGLAGIVDRFWPDSGLSRWFRTAAPALAPAVVAVKVNAPPKEGETGFAVTVNQGVAGSSTFNLALRSGGGLKDWRDKPASIDLVLDSPDSIGFARQIGIMAAAGAKDSGAHVEVRGKGPPGQGMDATFRGDLAGLAVSAAGKLTIAPDLAAAYTGSLGLASPNVDPLVAMAGLSIPGAAIGTAVKLDGALIWVGSGGELEWQGASIGGHAVAGKVSLARDGDRAWRIGGSLAVDDVDLGWLAALGLGFGPLPTGDPAAPWSKTPFVSPGYGAVSGKLQVSADRLAVGEDITVTGARLGVQLLPTRIDVDLSAGQTAGGKVTGGMSIHNVAGNASLGGRFNLQGAALESFVWQRNGRSVATGLLDLSANFEATGRSPAGLVQSMTGGGVIAVHKGEARYVNPAAARLVVRASDLGQQFSEDALRQNFAQQIDADSLAFGEAGGAFAIAAGQVRLKNLEMRGKGIVATGGGVLDLNAMTLDSDWTLAFDPVDAKVEGTAPRAGLVFRGPIDAPVRTVDVLPFSSYLNMRQEARMLEIIALDEATRAERERLNRLARKLREDGARRGEEARILADREARRRQAMVTQATALDQFHVSRDVMLDQRIAAGLASYAIRAAAESAAAQLSAGDAARVAVSERARADTAAKALASAVAAEQAANAAAQAAATELGAVRKTAESASGDLAAATSAASAADGAVADAAAIEAKASDAAAASVRERADAEAALKAVTAKVSAAVSASSKADAEAATAAAARASAEKIAAGALAARDAARADLSAAESAFAAARQGADQRVAAAAAAGKLAADARAAKSAADARAQTASAETSAATAARDAAQKALDNARAAAAAATSAAEAASNTAKIAAALAESMAGAEGADQAKQLADAAAATAAAKRAAADDAAKAVEDARASLALAEGRAKDAASAAALAVAAAQAAADTLKSAAAADSAATAASAAAQKDLAQKTAARDVATRVLASRQAQLDSAVSAAGDAASALAAATDRAAALRRDADKALAEKASASDAVAAKATAAEAAAKGAADTGLLRQSAVASAKSARDRADSLSGALGAIGKALTAKTAAADVAKAAARSAGETRIAAEKAAAEANGRASAAEAAAEAAQARAADKTRAADVARKAADRAAAAAGPIDPSLAMVPAAQPAAAAPAAETTGSAQPAVAPAAQVSAPAAAPVPAPRPKAQPLKILPEIPPSDRPLVIVPRP